LNIYTTKDFTIVVTSVADFLISYLDVVVLMENIV